MMGDDESADLEKQINETSELERRIADTIRKIQRLLKSEEDKNEDGLDRETNAIGNGGVYKTKTEDRRPKNEELI